MVWDSTYYYSKELFSNAKEYIEMNAKSRTLKKAWNAAFGLPYDYPGRDLLLREIENYAFDCGINLRNITGY